MQTMVLDRGPIDAAIRRRDNPRGTSSWRNPCTRQSGAFERLDSGGKMRRVRPRAAAGYRKREDSRYVRTRTLAPGGHGAAVTATARRMRARRAAEVRDRRLRGRCEDNRCHQCATVREQGDPGLGHHRADAETHGLSVWCRRYE